VAKNVEVSGPIRFANQFINMENRDVFLDDGSRAETCKAAMGYSMWAGPMDGPTGMMPQVQSCYKLDTRQPEMVYDLPY
jgi:hypothetical protein